MMKKKMPRYFLLSLTLLFLSGCAIHQKENIQKPLKTAAPIAANKGYPIYMRIFKEEKSLELWVKVAGEYKLYKTYPIQKTSGLLGPKQREGDRQNPEGIYLITQKNLNPYSRYHLSMNIGYPNRLDRNLKRTGDAIMIHGGCKSIGCFAMGDAPIEEIYTFAYNALTSGQKYFYVAIYPFKMTEKNLARYKESTWYPFWQNLKEGYMLFEATHTPPKVTVKGKKYCFKTIELSK